MQGLTILLFICNFYLLIIFKTGIRKNVLSNPSKRPYFSILRDSSVTERINRKKIGLSQMKLVPFQVLSHLEGT